MTISPNRNISILYTLVSFLFIISFEVQAQCTAGNITSPHTSTIYDAMLDPDADGYITESGAAFTSSTTEMLEFEIIPNSVTGWQEVQDVSEVDSDITPNCGNSDLVQDGDGGDFAFYNIIDPTPGTPVSGDEYILFRFRIAQSPNGNFGYNFLIDTDSTYGPTNDVNSICGNMGFEREVQFANAGGKKGVSVYDVDGSLALTTGICDQCITIGDVQEACAASSGNCATPDPQFVTFPVPLVHIGVASNVATSDFYIAAATASSGNATSVLGGGNVTDMGALDGGNTGCSCTGLTGCALFDCQTDCINFAFIGLPVELLYFELNKNEDNAILKWATATEINNSHFIIEHSTDGKEFSPVAVVEGAGNSQLTNEYEWIHDRPVPAVNYYRLKQMDFDGAFEYSAVKAVSFEPNATSKRFILLPNLVSDKMTVSFFVENREEIRLNIFDAMGRMVRSESFYGHSSVQMDISEFEAGNYYVQAKMGHEVLVERFVKL